MNYHNNLAENCHPWEFVLKSCYILTESFSDFLISVFVLKIFNPLISVSYIVAQKTGTLCFVRFNFVKY